MSELHFDTLERARQYVEQHIPNASLEKKSAFVNSVGYYVTGWSGSHPQMYEGPSVREHAAVHIFHQKGWQFVSFERAVELLISDEGPIFGPLTDVHRWCWENEYCFDDDPGDVDLLSR